MGFTEFCCRSGGSNLNGGGLASNGEPATAAVYTCVNSNWDGTSVFTPTDGSTPASTVTVGDFASVYLDAATVAVYIARVTAVAAGVNGAITLSTSAKSGAAPTSNATGRSIKVGGAWAGPAGAVDFPFDTITSALTNASAHHPRVNFKNDVTYTVSATISALGSVINQGYTSTFGDLGRATISGGTSGASYALISLAAKCHLVDLIFANNGSTGSARGIQDFNGLLLMERCVVTGIKGEAAYLGEVGTILNECEFYANNSSNTADTGVVRLVAVGITLRRCTIHDNTGNVVDGIFVGAARAHIENCIIESNGRDGIRCGTTSGPYSIQSCDFYNNGGSGISLLTTGFTSILYVENSNFVKNGGYGISGVADILGYVKNCGYGSGTQANTSGTTNLLTGVVESGAVNYATDVTPWADPANGDFRINLATAKGTGRGTFTQTAASYAGAVGYPDIGAAQHLESAGGGLLTHPGLSGGMRG